MLYKDYYSYDISTPFYVGIDYTHYEPEPVYGLTFTREDLEYFRKKYPEKAKEIEAEAKAVGEKFKKTLADLERQSNERERVKKLHADFDRLYDEDRDEPRKLCRKYFDNETTNSEASDANS